MSHENPPYKQGSGKFTSLAYKLLDIAQKVIHTIPSVRRLQKFTFLPRSF